MSWERSRWEADWVTCGTERDERQRVLADHRQLIFGQGQPVYDVLYEVVGDDRGHVPPQLSQDDQFPVLQRQRSKKKINKKVLGSKSTFLVLSGPQQLLVAWREGNSRVRRENHPF